MFLLVMLVGGPALASQGVTPEEEAKALQLWLDRGTGLEEARTALNAWTQLAQQAQDAEHWERVSVAWHWLALVQEEAHVAPAVRKQSFVEGARAAARAQQADPSRGGGYFWEAANEARAAEITGIVASVWLLPKLLRLMKLAEQHDPDCFYRGIDRARGLVITRTPEWLVRLKGGSLDDGEAYYAHAMEAAPQLVGNYVMWAELKLKRGEVEEARALLQRALNMPPASNPEIRGWNALERKGAARLMRTLGNV